MPSFPITLLKISFYPTYPCVFGSKFTLVPSSTLKMRKNHKKLACMICKVVIIVQTFWFLPKLQNIFWTFKIGSLVLWAIRPESILNRFWAGAVQPIYIRLLCSRITRVISEGHQWVINELSVGYQRVISGLSEGHQWVISELSVGYQLVSSGLSEGYQRVIRDLSVGYQWVIRGLSEIYQWVISGLSEGYQRFISGLSVGYQRVIRDLSVECHLHVKGSWSE